MKIEYGVTITGNQHESRERSTVEETEWCCDSMYNVWEASGYATIGFDTERHLVDLMSYDCLGDRGFWGGEALMFCPWCGETIETIRGETTDKRIKACAAELKRVSWYLAEEGRKAYCQNQPKNSSDYCGRHSHLEEEKDDGAEDNRSPG